MSRLRIAPVAILLCAWAFVTLATPSAALPVPVPSATPSVTATPWLPFGTEPTETPQATPTASSLDGTGLQDDVLAPLGTPPPGLSPSPTRPSTQRPSSLLRTVWSLLPTVVPPTPQPSAFFVPRLITATVGIDGAAGSRLQGRVLDWRGNGMAGISVHAASRQETRSALTGVDGGYLFDVLPADTYTVSIAGYDSRPVAPLRVDGQSIFIVEYIEAARPAAPAGTPTRTPSAGTPTPSPSAGARASVTGTPTPSRTALATPAGAATRSARATRDDAPLLSPEDVDFLSRTLLTPFLLGIAGGFIIFLVGMFGAGLRR